MPEKQHIAVDATLRKVAVDAAISGGAVSGGAGAISAAEGSLNASMPFSRVLPPRESQYCRKVYSEPAGFSFIFAIDTSESMGVEKRISSVQGTVLAFLSKAKEMKIRVSLIVFGGEEAGIALRPTESIYLAKRYLSSMEIGGATPLASGLAAVYDIVRQEERRIQGIQPVAMILTDGDANVPMVKGNNVADEVYNRCKAFRRTGLFSLFIDTSGSAASGFVSAEALHDENSYAGSVKTVGAGGAVSGAAPGGKGNNRVDLKHAASLAGGEYRSINSLETNRLFHSLDTLLADRSNT